MSDYIDILLTALEDELFPSLGKDYFLSLQQANDALTALCETLSPRQHKLFLAYEEAANAVSCISEDGLARSAFLLARGIFR